MSNVARNNGFESIIRNSRCSFKVKSLKRLRFNVCVICGRRIIGRQYIRSPVANFHDELASGCNRCVRKLNILC